MGSVLHALLPAVDVITIPPRISTRPATALIIMAVAAAVAVYFLLDPSAGVFPRCMFLTLTGWQCPGCGSQRALHALLHGEPGRAWAFNQLFAIEIPLIALLLVLWCLPGRFPRLERALYSRSFILAMLSIIIFWTIYRNL